ncbi:hypothetical protein ACF063_05915 [Streptomyces chartreusis]|uniref:hypothetical protein n=1 Tax=Streptomyces chartreusis TaxID=1969 RepID=UPI0036F670F6
MVEGMVRGFRARTDSRSQTEDAEIWTFRLERYDDAGQRIMLIPVEMRGTGFEGSVHDGDWVRTRGRIRGGTLHVKSLDNVTTGADVQTKRTSKIVWVFVVLFFCAILAFMGWVAFDLFFGEPASDPGRIP